MLRLHDTRLGSTVDIVPARRGQLRISACGPAAPGLAGLGSLRTFLLPDLIRRNAERHGLSVLLCQPVPDIDQAAGDSSDDGALPADCAALNIAPPDFAPRASESIDAIIAMVAALTETGHAYPADGGSVYFTASSAPGDEDWLLWRGAPPGAQPAWPAPWGSGRPSLTAACSAMSLRCLGDVIDIHAEAIREDPAPARAQQAVTAAMAGRDAVRHWIRGERTLFGDGTAGASGNVVRLGDVTGRGLDALAVRLAFLEARYVEPLEVSWAALTAADATVRNWREQVADWADEPSRPICAEYWQRITGALDDDLDTPAALRTLHALAADPQIPAGSKFETFAAADRVLALDLVSLIGRPRSGTTPG